VPVGVAPAASTMRLRAKMLSGAVPKPVWMTTPVALMMCHEGRIREPRGPDYLVDDHADRLVLCANAVQRDLLRLPDEHGQDLVRQ